MWEFSAAKTVEPVLQRLRITIPDGEHPLRSPVDGSILARISPHTAQQVEERIEAAQQAFQAWRTVPAPRRGELIRRFAAQVRQHQADLATLVTLESGKIHAEAQGEVQEVIDIADFAVGLSRQLYGLTLACERPGHRMMETWHPLGICATITAFNFPVAVWAWNAMIALVCGDPVLWKPSEKTPLTALACQKLLENAASAMEDVPAGLFSLAFGGPETVLALADDPRIPLVSATGSTAMGRVVAPRVAQRFGRCLLELGGNNAMILTPAADRALALQAIVFSAVATAGQRCTTLRRLFLHDSLYDAVIADLKRSYGKLTMGHPLHPDVRVGPLIDQRAFAAQQQALADAQAEGGQVLWGGERVGNGPEPAGTPGIWPEAWPEAWYIRPALVAMPAQTPVVCRETFAPILYILRYRHLEEAIAANNAVPQGLSSCIFSNDLREVEQFLGPAGSDCGIVNANIGPSGAEIGGAFGGEKETGGGREAGSDSWKTYMRRATNTINFSSALPLAQGVVFT